MLLNGPLKITAGTSLTNLPVPPTPPLESIRTSIEDKNGSKLKAKILNIRVFTASFL